MNESPFRRVLELLFGRRSSESEEEDGDSFKLSLMRSGLVTVTFLAVVVVGIGFLYHERGRGDLTRLENRIQPGIDHPAAEPPQLGGMEPAVVSRSQMMGGQMAQFLSATVLPGRGMNILQITAFLPGKGEIPLLASPTVEEAAKRMTGTGTDSYGSASLAMGAAPLIPWADGLTGTPTQIGGGASGPSEDGLATNWENERIAVPAALKTLPNGRMATPEAFGGLLLKRAADTFTTNAMPDGGETVGTFHAGDFNGSWPSSTDVEMTLLLSGRVLEVTLTAKNVGTVPEPMGIGWQPRFVVPSGERDQVRLQVPAPDRVEVSTGEGRTGREAGLPTGRLVSVDGTPYDLRADGGKTLPRGDFNVTYTNLKTGFLDGGPIVEMVDPASNYGLRITALTPRIKSFHVTSPASGEFISISPQYNMDDPLGHEWPKTQDTGMMVLLPGEKAEWKVRVELFDPSTEGKPAQLSHRDSTRRNLPIQPSAQDPIERGEKPGN